MDFCMHLSGSPEYINFQIIKILEMMKIHLLWNALHDGTMAPSHEYRYTLLNYGDLLIQANDENLTATVSEVFD